MVQVHALDVGAGWQLQVDGLRQVCASRNRVAVLREGRRVAAALGARLVVHDVDGAVVVQTDYAPARTRAPRTTWAEPRPPRGWVWDARAGWPAWVG